MNIGYLYYRFYPVTGGASIHGYYLARELSALGYSLFKINGDADPYTIKFSQSAWGAIKLFKKCDVIYIRADYFLNFRNLLGVFALFSKKKVVVELNAPSDELHLFGKSKKYIRRTDKIAGWLLKHADAIITVSKPVKTYCEEALHLKNVHIVENGGEVFPDKIIPSFDVKDKMGYICNRYSKRAVWAGSLNKMQDLNILVEIAKALPDQLAVIIITDDKEPAPFSGEIPSNIYIFNELPRNDVEYIIKHCQAGFAFYQRYKWSRWGFYNSSLKIFEYLNNDLLAITNIEGTDNQRKYRNFKKVTSAEQIITLLREETTWLNGGSVKRSWTDVANETHNIIQSL